MKILIVGLLCVLISNIYALESNSSLLESKGHSRTESFSNSGKRDLVLYMVSIKHKKDGSGVYTHFCTASMLNLLYAITVKGCASTIKEVEQKEVYYCIKARYSYPGYKVWSTKSAYSHETSENEIKYVFFPRANKQMIVSDFGILQLVDKVRTVGLENQVPILPTPPRHTGDHVVMYHWMGTDEGNMFVESTELKTIARGKVTPFGHLVSWNICTILPDRQEHEFLGERGSPLIYNGRLMGIYSGTVHNTVPPCYVFLGIDGYKDEIYPAIGVSLKRMH